MSDATGFNLLANGCAGVDFDDEVPELHREHVAGIKLKANGVSRILAANIKDGRAALCVETRTVRCRSCDRPRRAIGLECGT